MNVEIALGRARVGRVVRTMIIMRSRAGVRRPRLVPSVPVLPVFVACDPHDAASEPASLRTARIRPAARHAPSFQPLFRAACRASRASSWNRVVDAIDTGEPSMARRFPRAPSGSDAVETHAVVLWRAHARKRVCRARRPHRAKWLVRSHSAANGSIFRVRIRARAGDLVADVSRVDINPCPISAELSFGDHALEQRRGCTCARPARPAAPS